MTEVTVTKVICTDECGCPVPCIGGAACRCATVGVSTEQHHSVCSCGEHCSCNPCTCGRSGTGLRSGGGTCTCGVGCTCTTSACASR